MRARTHTRFRRARARMGAYAEEASIFAPLAGLLHCLHYQHGASHTQGFGELHQTRRTHRALLALALRTHYSCVVASRRVAHWRCLVTIRWPSFFAVQISSALLLKKTLWARFRSRGEISCGVIVDRPVVRWVCHHRATLLLWQSAGSLRLPRALAAWAWASCNVLLDTLTDQ
jgi:hypothetical protein